MRQLTVLTIESTDLPRGPSANWTLLVKAAQPLTDDSESRNVGMSWLERKLNNMREAVKEKSSPGASQMRESTYVPNRRDEGDPIESIYIFKGSPFEAFRKFPIWQKLRFSYAILRLFLNPDRTDMIFVATDMFVHNESKLAGDLHRYIEDLRANPDIDAMIKTGYRMPKFTVADLLACPEGSLGKAFGQHLHSNKLEPQFFSELNLSTPFAWLEMRGREIHDIIHVLTGFGIDVPSELGVQAFTLAQITSPISAMIIGGGLLHAGFFKPWLLPQTLRSIELGFTRGLQVDQRLLLSYRYEDNWERPLAEVRRELGIKV